jgi:hypothetical protein
MAQPEDERPPYEPAPPAARGKRGLYWQSDYALLVAAVVLVTAIAFAFFYFDLDITKLRTYGYLGVFAISLIGAASIFLPTPAIAAVFGGSVLLDPILGIPTPILVGLVAGLGEALGSSQDMQQGTAAARPSRTGPSTGSCGVGCTATARSRCSSSPPSPTRYSTSPG